MHKIITIHAERQYEWCTAFATFLLFLVLAIKRSNVYIFFNPPFQSLHSIPFTQRLPYSLAFLRINAVFAAHFLRPYGLHCHNYLSETKTTASDINMYADSIANALAWIKLYKIPFSFDTGFSAGAWVSSLELISHIFSIGFLNDVSYHVFPSTKHLKLEQIHYTYSSVPKISYLVSTRSFLLCSLSLTWLKLG